MPTLKEVELKIKAVKKTQKITKAMNMVAASKLSRALEKMEAFRPYANKFAEVLGSLAERAAGDEENAPALLAPRAEVKTIDVVLMTSDRGLCGSFNTNLLATCEKFLKENIKPWPPTPRPPPTKKHALLPVRQGMVYFDNKALDYFIEDFKAFVSFADCHLLTEQHNVKNFHDVAELESNLNRTALTGVSE